MVIVALCQEKRCAPIWLSRVNSELSLPVVHVVGGGLGRVPPVAVVGDDFSGIGVLANFRVGHRADRKERKIGIRVVHDLVRRLRSADRAADDIARPDPALFLAVAQRAAARDDEEHLFLGAMAVEGAAALARRQHVVGVAESTRAEQRTDARRAPLELVALHAVLEPQLIEVHDILHLAAAHRSISPKTMSCVPMIATASASMWPRAISSSAARCAKAGARSFMR